MTLPPLPSPNVEVISGHREPFVSYDADQMREYGQQCREAALEEAAQILSTPEADRVPVMHHCANAIRNMKDLK